ncbi:MAG: hypothetical protein VX501_07445 [Pseudomonadota bacterium]|nr:hypothetical protein [Pseudomonadota bacterium]
MGIEVSSLEVRGVSLVKLTGEVARTDLGASLMVIEKFVQSGELRAVIVDARDVVMLQRRALPAGFPVAYIAPPGFHEHRSEGVAEAAREWSSNLKITEALEDATGWVSAQLAKRTLINNRS